MQVLKFIRSYYLYFYFHTTELKKRNKEDAFPANGFAAMTLLVMVFHAGMILYTINALWFEFITDSFKKELFNFRGEVNGILLLSVFIGILLTYLTCCYGIKYDEIKERLKKTRYLANRSAIKLTLLPILSFSLFVSVFVMFYSN